MGVFIVRTCVPKWVFYPSEKTRQEVMQCFQSFCPCSNILELPFWEFPLNSGCPRAQTFQSSAPMRMRTDGIFIVISLLVNYSENGGWPPWWMLVGPGDGMSILAAVGASHGSFILSLHHVCHLCLSMSRELLKLAVIGHGSTWRLFPCAWNP